MSADVGVLVFIPPPLRDLTDGQETVRAEGSTVGAVITSLDQHFPGMRERLCEGGELRPGLAVVVGTEVAPLGLRQPVPSGSEVHFLPAISGG